jgi:peptidoglycan/LPS O-acetylase OafA/YrhL
MIGNTVRKVILASGIVSVLLALIALVFADGLRRYHSGIFFAVMGTVMLVSTRRRRRGTPPPTQTRV